MVSLEKQQRVQQIALRLLKFYKLRRLRTFFKTLHQVSAWGSRESQVVPFFLNSEILKWSHSNKGSSHLLSNSNLIILEFISEISFPYVFMNLFIHSTVTWMICTGSLGPDTELQRKKGGRGEGALNPDLEDTVHWEADTRLPAHPHTTL